MCVSVQIVAHADLFKKGRVTNYEGLKTPNSITKKGIMDQQQNPPNEPGKSPSPGQGGQQQDKEREERERQRREREKQGGGQQGAGQQGAGQQGGR